MYYSREEIFCGIKRTSLSVINTQPNGSASSLYSTLGVIFHFFLYQRCKTTRESIPNKDPAAITVHNHEEMESIRGVCSAAPLKSWMGLLEWDEDRTAARSC